MSSSLTGDSETLRVLALLGPHDVPAAYAKNVDSVLLRHDLDDLPEALDLIGHGYRLSPVLTPDSVGMAPEDGALLALLVTGRSERGPRLGG